MVWLVDWLVGGRVWIDGTVWLVGMVGGWLVERDE